ncbi:MAG: hypothetical protein WBQ69_00795 [Gallionella sp.]
MADDIAASAVSLNADARSARLDRAALDAAIRAKGPAFQDAISVGHDHLFADVPVFISPKYLRKMYEVISAVEQVTGLPGWQPESDAVKPAAKGLLFGYDFHLNAQGVHLIEINTNAGGAFLNELLIASQRDAGMPGRTAAIENLESSLLAMFRNEWRLERGSAPLGTIAIVDERPEDQYLYPEFLLANEMLERDGIKVHIVDPSMLLAREDGLFFGYERIDLVYNRLTDFSLQRHPVLLDACSAEKAVLTPHPYHYTRFADKRNLARLTDAQGLHAMGAKDDDIATLQAGIPQTVVVRKDMESALWEERKRWFFKPNSGYGGKGAYSGVKVTKRVFGEILQGDYVAQKMAPPGERAISVDGAEAVLLKYDVRCYVYEGKIQLVAARLYQGQTTNFRTPGGGFALVRVVE